MDAYYETVHVQAAEEQGLGLPFFPDRVRGTRPTYDLVDAATGEVIAEAARKSRRAPSRN